MKLWRIIKKFGFSGKNEFYSMNTLTPHPSVAVLYQAAPPPDIGGIPKPVKPGGYSDSGADIAYNLRLNGISVITPVIKPDPEKQFDWVFPDTQEGIQEAIARGASILWANTVLYNGHPLDKIAANPDISIIGQLPALTQKYDDKWITNEELKATGLTVAPSCLISCNTSASSPHLLNLNDLSEQQLINQGLKFPLVVKPIRGRGSQGVSVVKTFGELKLQINNLTAETDIATGHSFAKFGQAFIVEQYMPGQEITITVMPPGVYRINDQLQNKNYYWSLPIVKRFNHVNGIAPYNGAVAVVNNSSLLNESELDDPRYAVVQRECEKAAEMVGAKAMIRIDCREGADGKFYLFDLNMKPNLTGPGRPGREYQDSLTSIAGRSKLIGWDYGELLQNMYHQAWPANLISKNIPLIVNLRQISV